MFKDTPIRDNGKLLPKWLDENLISWAQYLRWADVNFNRYVCSDEDTATEIAIAFQWFASEYVVIEGWKEIKHRENGVTTILDANAEGIELLRRARNAVYHFHKSPLDKKLVDFAIAFGANGWLIDLHQSFLKYLLDYPAAVYPHSVRKEEFIGDFFGLVGWRPELLRS